LATVRLAGGTRLGAYEIVEPLGAGGMGEVYRARDARLDRDVAIKVLPPALSEDPAALARFEREAKAVAALSHPAILAIFEFGSLEGVAYAVTELLEGETLRERLEPGALPARKAVEYAIQIAEGLAAAHERGIVHRDLKPENVFVTKDDRVKILDFGLARQTVVPADDTSSPTLSRHTDPGTILGTVGYMSPEQVRGKSAGPASDIFSFGVVFYEMLTGRRAFKGDSAAETMNAILKEEPPDLETSPGLSAALERIVRHCLEKRAEQRFHSAHDVAFDLKALGVDSGTRPRSDQKARIDARRVLGAALLLVIGATVGVFVDRAVRRVPLAEQPNYRRLTFDQGTVGNARFAPNSNTVVYDAAWRGAPSEVFTTRLDARESRAHGVPGVLYSVATATSELAVGLHSGLPLVGGVLARVPLAGGAPREVLEGVTCADWSPDGTEMAVVHVRQERQRVEYPIGRVLYETRGNISHLRVSPRGDRVAFIEHPAGSPLTGGSVIASDRSGGKRTLSEDWGNVWGLAWRPDGGEIWFTAVRRGEAFKTLRAVTLDGKERLVARLLGYNDLEDVAPDGRVLLSHLDFRILIKARPPGSGSEKDLTWLGMSAIGDLSNDGRRALFTELDEGPGEGGFTYVRDTSGAPAVRLGEGTALALSPDGKWALSRLTSPSRLILLPVGVGQERTLTRRGLDYVGGGGWFPDSGRVFFTAHEGSAPSRLYVQGIEGGEPRPVGPSEIAFPTMAPDGRTIAALARGRDVVLFSVDGGEERPIRGAEPGDVPGRWSRDGSSLFVTRLAGRNREVHQLELSTGHRKRVWQLASEDPTGAFPPGAGTGPAVSLTPDGKSYAYSYARILSDLYLVDGLK
jgi:eukaryotic-like serine/threonine-protein kinase